MKQHQHSRTAEVAAGRRAIHRRIDRPRVFDDPWVLALTSDAMRRLERTGPLLRLLLRDPLGLSGAARGHVVGRSRFAEDHLADAVRRGFAQYVIVGAGLDSFAARRPPGSEDLAVFELDHPDTQRAKRARMQALAGADHRPPHYVPIDFERQSLDAALAQCAKFDAGRPAFFSWPAAYQGGRVQFGMRALSRRLDDKGAKVCAAPKAWRTSGRCAPRAAPSR